MLNESKKDALVLFFEYIFQNNEDTIGKEFAFMDNRINNIVDRITTIETLLNEIKDKIGPDNDFKDEEISLTKKGTLIQNGVEFDIDEETGNFTPITEKQPKPKRNSKTPYKITNPKTSKRNGNAWKTELKNNPNEPHNFADSYTRNITYEVTNDGFIKSTTGTKKFPDYQILNLFEKVPSFPLLNKDVDSLKSYIKSHIDMTLPIALSFVYRTQRELKQGQGNKIDVLYELYENELMNNPQFKLMNKQLCLNDVDCGVSIHGVKQAFNEIKNSSYPKAKILELIHNGRQKGVVRKYWVNLLMNYENESLIRCLEGF